MFKNPRVLEEGSDKFAAIIHPPLSRMSLRSFEWVTFKLETLVYVRTSLDEFAGRVVFGVVL